MKYYKVIEENIREVLASTNGRKIIEKHDGDEWMVGFPNTVLHTNDGTQFNVMGYLWRKGLEKERDSSLYFLVVEPRTDFSNVTSIFQAGAGGTCFVVTTEGKLNDKEQEKPFIVVFRSYAAEYKKKYGVVPGFLMFLSEEQLSYRL